jgi:hypothetical protein
MSEDRCHMPSFTSNKKLKVFEQVTPVLPVARIMSFSALFLFKPRKGEREESFGHTNVESPINII